MTRRPAYGDEYVEYGRPSPRVRRFARRVARAVEDGDPASAEAAIDEALAALRAEIHLAHQTPASNGDGTDRGHSAADGSST